MNDLALRVLLVEDTPSEADLTRFYLSRISSTRYDMVHVPTLNQAVDSLYNNDLPDIILLDLHLPDCEGLGGFERLHSLAPDVPVIILTNFMDDELATRAVREGAQDYLIKKEVDTALLNKSIRYAIERQKSDAALRESEERYALAVAGASEGIWDWNIRTGEAYFSPRWQDLVGVFQENVTAHIDHWFDRVHPDDLPPLQAALQAHFRDVQTHFEYEHRVMHEEGEYRWMLVRGQAICDARDKCYRMAGSMADITERRRAEQQLLHDALHDGLMDLPNRSLFMDRLDQAIRQHQRDGSKQYAVLYFDIDRFKNVNDSLGHSVGDRLLVGIARRLETILRPSDTLARLSGDEFAVLLTQVGTTECALSVVQRIHQLLRRKFKVQGNVIYPSIGIAMASDQYDSPEQVLRDADLAMYRAKSLDEPGDAVVFDAHMHATAVQRLRLETDMRRAIDRGEFVIHYQPIVSLQTGQVLSFEALLRWQHPQRGLVSPNEFIGVAEETGMISELSWWILKTAATQTRRWQKLILGNADLGISVNVTGALFRNENMADDLLSLLEECDLQPGYMHLEITERSFMDHQDAVLAELDKLKSAGVQLHVDDFGTGYSSLSYLKRYSYDTLKIDRSFIRDVTSMGDASAIVQAIVSLGQDLKMNIVAEGVENVEQVQLLRKMDCPEAQGYWFSRPLTREKAHQVLSQPLKLN
ncbi:putative bifunctional diguanylate cyclase/phosphodiesterase [Thiolapillus sp.]